MKKACIAAATAAVVLSACATDPEPDTICFDDWLYPEDVYGAGYYSDRREEFEEATGCKSPLGCTGRMKFHRCVDNVEFK